MKQIPKKNYFILVVLLVVTAVLTLALANIYKNRDKLVSNFYENSNVITPDDFDEVILENSDVIIYISDKYDLTHATFEKKFESKINEKNLKHNLIYIDISNIDKKFLTRLKKDYGIEIDMEKIPMIIVIVDKKVIKNISVNNETKVDNLIEYEAFE